MQNNDKGSEEKKRKSTTKKVPQSIIDHYSKYRNKSLTIKPVIVMGTRFEIEERYQIIDAVGQGAYGIVVAAKDHMNADVMVAIKKIEKAFEHKIFTKRTLRELRILRLLNHENIISLKSILLPKSRETFEDIYCVTELMETDMAQIIRSPQPISDDHIQFFIYQILRGLKYLHSCRIMHRDLKPRNLLMNSNCDLKICDFGLARSMEVEEAVMDMTDYVATRWYRAPELLLAHKDYSPAIDVWSVGCILAELLKRKPFLPGIDSRNQLELIIDLLGTPSDKLVEQIPREKIRRLINSWPKKEAKNFSDLFPASNPLAVDLLEKLLQFDPSKRITVEEALNHEYLQQFHCPSDEPVGTPVDTIEFEFEMFDLNREQLKDLIYEEILLYHFEDFEKEYEAKKKKKESIIAHILKNDNALYKENDNTDD